MQQETIAASKACADFVAGIRFEDIPADVLDTIKRDTLDWIGCAVGGAADPASRPIKAVTQTLSGQTQASAIDNRDLDVVHAAMSNAYYLSLIHI